MNAQRRQAIQVAVQFVEAMPKDGWSFDIIERDVQWHIAQALDSHMFFSEADAMWDGLLARMEQAAAAEDGLTDERIALYVGYLSRGRSLQASSTRHLGAENHKR